MLMGLGPPRRRETDTRIRLFNEEKALLELAADRAGMELSTWLRTIALHEARKVLRREQE
jgi:uncharacterized protein (DUF1778 family)